MVYNSVLRLSLTIVEMCSCMVNESSYQVQEEGVHASPQSHRGQVTQACPVGTPHEALQHVLHTGDRHTDRETAPASLKTERQSAMGDSGRVREKRSRRDSRRWSVGTGCTLLCSRERREGQE